jgi:hypothetical protein
VLCLTLDELSVFRRQKSVRQFDGRGKAKLRSDRLRTTGGRGGISQRKSAVLMLKSFSSITLLLVKQMEPMPKAIQ